MTPAHAPTIFLFVKVITFQRRKRQETCGTKPTSAVIFTRIFVTDSEAALALGYTIGVSWCIIVKSIAVVTVLDVCTVTQESSNIIDKIAKNYIETIFKPT